MICGPTDTTRTGYEDFGITLLSKFCIIGNIQASHGNLFSRWMEEAK
jgi:hypothetical protein